MHGPFLSKNSPPPKVHGCARCAIFLLELHISRRSSASKGLTLFLPPTGPSVTASLAIYCPENCPFVQYNLLKFSLENITCFITWRYHKPISHDYLPLPTAIALSSMKWFNNGDEEADFERDARFSWNNMGIRSEGSKIRSTSNRSTWRSRDVVRGDLIKDACPY